MAESPGPVPGGEPAVAARLDAIVRANDIRGRVPAELDEALARRLGEAFAAFFTEDDPRTAEVLVGRDMRLSGLNLSGAFCAGLQATGLDVVDLGLTSTDMLYFAAGHLDAPGVVFTASHNPAGYNGIKACRSGARPLSGERDLARVRQLALLPPLPPAAAPGGRRQLDLLETFARHVRSFTDAESMRPLRVVADVANGMGALVVPAVFEGLPPILEVLHGELDGSFPNHPPDPLQEANLADLCRRVDEAGADVGLAFDGDADRVFFVDDRGRPLSGSVTAALLAGAVLRRNPGALVLYNAACSRVVSEAVEEAGGRSLRTRVGHSLIKERMAETGAAFAGEHSGHYYFAENHCSDSGVLAAVALLEELSRAGMPLSELRRPFDRYAASGEVNFTVADPRAVTEALARRYRHHHQDRLDGLTVDCGDWWFNLRPSNTEPLLRLNLEAADAGDCARYLTELRAAIELSA
ncbi:MAG: phosphomannomutase/phosphoglucomutase [bacterium]|nr:phosphomannomutase/phosphoglucomutase [bacterium]